MIAPEIFAGNTVNKKNSKLFSMGSKFNRVNGSSQNLEEKKGHAKLLKNDPGYIFNDSRSQILTVKKYLRFNIQR
jgi:hypothetical protein